MSRKYTLSGKKSRGKVTKCLPNEIFPRLSFSRPVFLPDFFSPDKEFIPIFSSIIIIIIIIIISSYLFAKFITTLFFFMYFTYRG